MINFFYKFFFLFLTHSLAFSLALLLCSFHIIYFNQKIFAFRGKVLFLCFFPNSHFFFEKKFPTQMQKELLPVMMICVKGTQMRPNNENVGNVMHTCKKKKHFFREIGSFSILFSSQLYECARVKILSHFQVSLYEYHKKNTFLCMGMIQYIKIMCFKLGKIFLCDFLIFLPFLLFSLFLSAVDSRSTQSYNLIAFIFRVFVR